MNKPIWVLKETVLAIHHRQLIEHGGTDGIRDENLLDSALNRPKNLFAYSDSPPKMTRLAASYGFGITRNHPFIDGNKRVAFVVSLLFLQLNGQIIITSATEKFKTVMVLSTGQMTEEAYATWLEQHSQSL